MTKAGHSDSSIAYRLKRTKIAVAHRRKNYKEQIARRQNSTQAKPRTCLRCHHKFNSAGPGNRICRNCTGSNIYVPNYRVNL